VSTARSTPGRLGGLGAVFFLASLGAIAFYVQQQSVPEDRDVVRKAATVVPEAVAQEKPPALPWEDRLEPFSATLVPLLSPSADSGDPSGVQPGTQGATPASDTPPDPATSRYVQDLNDGHRILLTLDPVMQDSMLQIFRNREVPYGAAVMIDLRDSAVLVLAGHSSMDPQVDAREIVATAWAPAASTFKLVTAAALLAGETTPSTKVCFNGGLHGIEDAQLADDPARDTRCETLSSAIAHSHNLVIGKLALRHLEQNQLADVARALLFESEIPFELGVERSPAHIPSEAIERAKVAAGFWNVDMSPLHGALMASIFARSGMFQPPHLIAAVMGPDGSDLTPAAPKPQRVLSRDVADAVAVMMRDTTRVGTARTSFRDKQGNPYIRDVEVAGKTGSLTGKRAPALNYNWFVGFAPAERPEVAFAVLLANEPKWRIKAHYAARRMVQIYLERQEAITRGRDAQLTLDGLLLPERGPGGVLVSSSPPRTDDEASPSAASSDASDPPTAEPLPPPPENDTLPPVPGALPKPPVD
jgi:penicillin-binding protein A